jgi:hypothetical protein
MELEPMEMEEDAVKEATKKKTIELPSKWLTVQLEAFSILCMENYMEMVTDQIDNKVNPRGPRWTADGRGKAKNQGWDKDGILRYNELVKIVRTSRRGRLTCRRKLFESQEGRKGCQRFQTVEEEARCFGRERERFGGSR